MHGAGAAMADGVSRVRFKLLIIGRASASMAVHENENDDDGEEENEEKWKFSVLKIATKA